MSDSKEKRVNVSGTVTEALNEFVENYRWSNRKSKSDVISEALTAWATTKGFTEPKTGEDKTAENVSAPASGATAEPAKAGAPAQPARRVS